MFKSLQKDIKTMLWGYNAIKIINSKIACLKVFVDKKTSDIRTF